MASDVMPTVKWTSFLLSGLGIGALTTQLVLLYPAFWWTAIPVVALVGFVGYRISRVKAGREHVYLAVLISMLVARAIEMLLA